MARRYCRAVVQHTAHPWPSGTGTRRPRAGAGAGDPEATGTSRRAGKPSSAAGQEEGKGRGGEEEKGNQSGWSHESASSIERTRGSLGSRKVKASENNKAK